MCKEDFWKKIEDFRKLDLEEHEKIKDTISEVNNNAINGMQNIKEILSTKIDALKTEIKSANMISGFNKWLFGIAVLLITFFSGASSYYIRESYKSKATDEIKTAKLLVAVQKIERKYAEQQGVLLHVDDTLERTIKNVNLFYSKIWRNHLIHDRRLTDSVRFDRKMLNDHERRIVKLERKIK